MTYFLSTNIKQCLRMRNFVIVSNVENNKDKLSGFSTGVLKCYIFVNYKMHTKKEKTKKRKKKE